MALEGESHLASNRVKYVCWSLTGYLQHAVPKCKDRYCQSAPCSPESCLPQMWQPQHSRPPPAHGRAAWSAPASRCLRPTHLLHTEKNLSLGPSRHGYSNWKHHCCQQRFCSKQRYCMHCAPAALINPSVCYISFSFLQRTNDSMLLQGASSNISGSMQTAAVLAMHDSLNERLPQCPCPHITHQLLLSTSNTQSLTHRGGWSGAATGAATLTLGRAGEALAHGRGQARLRHGLHAALRLGARRIHRLEVLHMRQHIRMPAPRARQGPIHPQTLQPACSRPEPKWGSLQARVPAPWTRRRAP